MRITWLCPCSTFRRDYGWDEAEVLEIILLLKERGLIKSMEFNSYTRIHHDDQEIKIVKQMPTITSNNQPTIAIITAQYCEKLAVDAMIENKETFVRYTTVGKWQRSWTDYVPCTVEQSVYSACDRRKQHDLLLF